MGQSQRLACGNPPACRRSDKLAAFRASRAYEETLSASRSLRDSKTCTYDRMSMPSSTIN